MYDFDKHLSALSEQTVLCIGDLMLDEFVYGDVARISPEAPTPVIAVKRTELMVGGAGNVARNLVALGARCIFVGAVGDDAAGTALTKALGTHSLIEFHLVVDGRRQTTRKVRFVSEHHSTHLLRADWETPSAVDAGSEDALIAHAIGAMSRVGAMVLSDYAKGTLTPRVVRTVIDAANEHGKPVIVDPKGRDYSIYRGATLITPNRQELADATRSRAQSDEEIADAAANLRAAIDTKAVLVTRSEAGMSLVSDRTQVHIPAYPVRVRDVSGAGDTVVAILSAMLAMGADFESAMRAANAAAAVVVGKRGTATLSVAELRTRILPASTLAPEEKIVFDWAVLDDHLIEWRKQGLRVGFTNGCFDLLHPGHVKLLAGARAACDRLIVGLNSDASVSRLKGPGRPVQPVQARAEVLAALEAVNLVAVFDEDTPEKLISRVKPIVLVKGSDYTREEVVGREIVEALGGEIILVEIVPGHSTTSMVERTRSSQARSSLKESVLPRTNSDHEMRLVAAFFGDIRGYFVEVGANDPRERSQTWLLEQSGWTGILIEPQPDLAAELRARRKAKVFSVACSSPGNAGRKMPLHVAGPLSSLDRRHMAPGAMPERVIKVPVRTLDSILEEAETPAKFDFLSVDVEGHEIEVLRGFDIAHWQPRLILLEDHVADLSKHRFLTSAGYRIIRRYENNGWYVPRESPVVRHWADQWEILRKYYLALPFRMLRNLSRRVRKPITF